MSIEQAPRDPADPVALVERLRAACMVPAGRAQRFGAAAVDLVYATVLACVPVTTAVLLLGLDGSLRPQHPVLLASLLVALVVAVGYGIVWPDLDGGRSPGKQVLGLRVVRVDGTPAGLREHVVRWLLLGVDLLGIGAVLVLCTRDGRRLGDLVAGTVVLTEQAPPLDEVPAYLRDRSTAGWPPSDWH